MKAPRTYTPHSKLKDIHYAEYASAKDQQAKDLISWSPHVIVKEA